MARSPRYEGSREDNAKDAKMAKRMGMSRSRFEKSKLDAKAKKKRK